MTAAAAARMYGFSLPSCGMVLKHGAHQLVVKKHLVALSWPARAVNDRGRQPKSIAEGCARRVGAAARGVPTCIWSWCALATSELRSMIRGRRRREVN